MPSTFVKKEYTPNTIIQECTHKIWNIRSRAYKNLIEQFKNIYPYSETWDAFKGTMCHVASESSPAIRGQALEVLLLFVERCATAGDNCVDIMKCLLDNIHVSSRAQSEESIMSITLQFVEIGCSEQVLDLLIMTASETNKPRTSKFCIHLITKILSEYGPKPIKVKSIIDSLLHFNETNDPDIHDAMKSLIMELYSWLGTISIPHIDKILDHSSVNAIKKEFDEKKRKEKREPVRFVRIRKKNDSDNFSYDNIRTKGFDLGQVDDSVLKKLESPDWSVRRDTLEELNSVLEQCTILYPGYHNSILNSLKKMIVEDQCVIVVSCAITCLTEIAKILKHNFSPNAVPFCRILLEKFVEKRQNITDQLRVALDVIASTTSFESLIKVINSSLDSKNPTVRFETIQLLARLFKKSTRQTLRKPEFAILFKSLVGCLHHGQLIIREKSIASLAVAIFVAGEDAIMPHLKLIDPLTKKRIRKLEKVPGSFGEKYNEIRYRNVAKKESNIKENKPAILNRPTKSKKNKLSKIKPENDTSGKMIYDTLRHPIIRKEMSKLQRPASLEKKIKATREKNATGVNISEQLNIYNSESSFDWLTSPSEQDKLSNDNNAIKEIIHEKTCSQLNYNKQNKDSGLSISNEIKTDDVNIYERTNDAFDGLLNKYYDFKGGVGIGNENLFTEEESSERKLKGNLRYKNSEQGISLLTQQQQTLFPIEEINSTSESGNSIPQLHKTITFRNNMNTDQTKLSLSNSKGSEGFIVLTENEVKSLLGLKKNIGSFTNEDSGTVLFEGANRRNVTKRPCKIFHITKKATEKDTQTDQVTAKDGKIDYCSKSDETSYVIPTQTACVSIEERGTNPFRVKRFNRGTQWIMRASTLPERQTQTTKATTAEVASGTINDFSTSKSEKDINQQSIAIHRKNKGFQTDLKSVQSINTQRQSGKEVRKLSNDSSDNELVGTEQTLQISTFTLTRSNPLIEPGLEQNNLNIKPTEVKRHTKIMKEKVNQTFCGDKQCNSTSFVRTIFDQDENLTKTVHITSKNNSVKRGSKKGRMKSSKNEIRLRTSTHSSTSIQTHSYLASRKEGEKSCHLNSEEKFIRLKKLEISKLKSRSITSKKEFENPSLKKYKIKRSQLSLTKPTQFKTRQTSPQHSNTRQETKENYNVFEDSSITIIKEGCNLLPMLKKGTNYKNDKKQSKFKRRNSGSEKFKTHNNVIKRRKEDWTNQVKSLVDHENRNVFSQTKKLYTGEQKQPKLPDWAYQGMKKDSGESYNLDPCTKQMILSELLKVCDISQATFEKMIRSKTSRHCLLTPKAIIQRVNVLSGNSEQKREAEYEGGKIKDIRSCTIM